MTGSTLTTTNGNGVVSFGGGTSATITGSTISSSLAAVNAAQDATVTDSTLSSSAGVGALGTAGNVVVDGSSVTGANGGAIAGTNATVTASEITSSGGEGLLAGVGGRASVERKFGLVNGQVGGVQAGLDVTITGSRITSGGGLGALYLRDRDCRELLDQRRSPRGGRQHRCRRHEHRADRRCERRCGHQQRDGDTDWIDRHRRRGLRCSAPAGVDVVGTPRFPGTRAAACSRPTAT